MARRSHKTAEQERYPEVSRLYSTARWRRVRKDQLRKEPLCRACKRQGIATPATVCDHVDPHKGDLLKFWRGPFQSLCKNHHDSYKQQLERRGFDVEIDASGWPVDGKHPAHKKRE